MPQNLPPCPTPIKVAAILLIVAGGGLQSVAVVVDAFLFGFPLLLTLLAALPCGFLVSFGAWLNQGMVPGVKGLAWWLGRGGLLAATPAVTALGHGVLDTLRSSAPFDFQRGFALGSIGVVATSSIAVLCASILLDVHSVAYTRWREARYPDEEEPGFEYVDD